MKIKTIFLAIISLFITNVAMGAEKKKDMKTQLLEKIVDQSVIDEIDRKADPMKNFSNILNVIKGVDPTRPEKRKPVEVAAPDTEEEKEVDPDDVAPINLTAIFFSDKNKYAIINGKIVKEGGVVNERVLKKIYKNKILIEDFDADKEIKLPSLKIVTTLEEAREQEKLEKERKEQERQNEEKLKQQLLEQEQQKKK